jgi:two-component system, NarL family, nitrate/nitrite response regulator NarL
MTENLKILIVAENPLARMGLAALLAGQAGINIVGQTAGGINLPDEIDLYRPDALIWDWGWENHPDRLADVRDSTMPVLALLNNAAQTADAWASGARGLLLHDTDADSLVAALQALDQGLAVIDPALTLTLFPVSNTTLATPAEALTPREMEVLQLLAEGLPNKTIASRLSVTDHTVKFHVNAIMGKLGVQSRTEAVVRATRLGLIIL